jgi:hypothetical protein
MIAVEQVARDGFAGLRKRVCDAIHSSRVRGMKPTVVLLGRMQWDIIAAWQDENWERHRNDPYFPMPDLSMPCTFRGLRIVWTNDPDSVAVYEERKGVWC